MEQISRHFRRSFHDASVSHSSLARAIPRASAPISAEFPPLISVACTWIHDNREGHQLATGIKRRSDGSRQTPKAEEFASARGAGTNPRAAWQWPRSAVGRVGSPARSSRRAEGVRGANEGTPYDALLTWQEATR